MSAELIVTVLVVLAVALVGLWLAVEVRRAPQGCDDCQGLTDCPACGPLAWRVSR